MCQMCVTFAEFPQHTQALAATFGAREIMRDAVLRGEDVPKDAIEQTRLDIIAIAGELEVPVASIMQALGT